MTQENKLKLWVRAGWALAVPCTPLGIFTWIKAYKLNSALKIGNYAEAERHAQDIKTCWKIVGVVYALLFGFAIIGAIFGG